jgi:serine protease AprX
MSRLGVRLVLVAVLSLALVPGLVGAEPPQRAMVHPLVWDTLDAQGEADVLVVLRAQADLSGATAQPTKEAKGRYVYEALRAVAETTQPALLADLDARGVEYRAFYLVNMVQMRANRALVEALAARADVARIEPNPWVRGIPDEPLAAADAPASIEPNLLRVHADEVWALGYTGQGVVVAGNDTGIDWDHPALVNHYRAQQPGYGRHDFNWHDAIHSGGGSCGADSPVPCDDYGHGTHTIGTVVGDDGGSNQVGMAPGAEWIGCRNMNVGDGSPATYIECFEFFLAPYPLDGTPAQGDPALAPDVINNSWSCPASEGCSPDTLEAAVGALRQAGIVVVVSAGNSGSSCASLTTPPAIYRQSLSVAAFNHTTDQIASFSARGPVTYGGETYRKPEIAAPGVSIRSSVPGGGYAYLQGTSMAAPHVSGAVALLLSAAPAYKGQVDTLELALTGTAEPKTTNQGCGGDGPSDVPNNVWGWGILDSLAAVQWLTSGSLRGTVSEAGSGTPLAGAEVRAEPVSGGGSLQTLTDPGGDYGLTLVAGAYDVTAQASGYFSLTVANLPITETTTLDFALAQRVQPQAGFENNGPVCLDEPLVLTNTSLGALSWLWDLGDGAQSDAWQPAHFYDAAGAYAVTLTITNPLATDTASATVTVEPLPVAAFHWLTDGLTVSFVNDSQDADAYLWAFGDGVTSTLPAPTHTYAISGTYVVDLLAANGCGTDAHAAGVWVGGGPAARIYLPFVLKH